MAYNKLNRYRFYKKVLDIVNTHYISGVTTYSGIFHEYVEPVYPMSYNSFMKIVNMPNLDGRIAEEEAVLATNARIIEKVES